jgi:non-specific serine/threonine protein kinase
MASPGSLVQEGNLPAESTSFVGRREDIANARRLLARVRMVTLTGVGGVGKSRLALRIGASVRTRFPGGVWMVALAAVQDPEWVPLAVADALGIRDQSRDAVLQVLVEQLGDARTLIVLDNCEHLLDACAAFCEVVLPAAAGLKVLATSRQSLGVAGEHILIVEPLPTPDPAGPRPSRRHPALSLFAHRAEVAAPGFAMTAENRAAVAHLCHRLEGLPLAIELAAVRLGTLDLRDLVSQIDDRYDVLTAGTPGAIPRHQTLRAAIDWSFQLCTGAEQAMWSRASVFAGSFDLAAAEGVCGDDGLPVETIYELVDGLVDKSILAREDHAGLARYRLLETVRQYGQDRLHESGATTALHVRHRDWYLDLAERLDADWFGPRQLQWADQILTELPNLRAALGFCLTEPGQGDAGLRLAGALQYLWWGCGQLREGRIWLERALPADPEPSRYRARALTAYGIVLTQQGLHDRATAPLQEAIALARELGEPLLLAPPLEWAGLNAIHRGDPTAGVARMDEALAAVGGRTGDMALAAALQYRGMGAMLTGDPVTALDLLARGREICYAHGELLMLSYTLVAAIQPALMVGDTAQAAAYAREAVPLNVAFNDAFGLNVVMNWLAGVAAAERDHRRVARLYGAERRLALAIGGSPFDAGELLQFRHAAEDPARAALGDDAYEAEFQYGYELSREGAVALVVELPAQGTSRT